VTGPATAPIAAPPRAAVPRSLSPPGVRAASKAPSATGVAAIFPMPSAVAPRARTPTGSAMPETSPTAGATRACQCRPAYTSAARDISGVDTIFSTSTRPAVRPLSGAPAVRAMAVSGP
jgi:hypothetical protein